MKLQKSLKFSLTIINVSIFLLFALAIALPPLVTWFVEFKNKDAGLPLVVMLTCYPCLPFAVASLFSLRKFLKNCLDGIIFCDKNISSLKIVSVSCLCGSAITFIAGYFYLPFYVVSISAIGCTLFIRVIKDIIASQIKPDSEQQPETKESEV